MTVRQISRTWWPSVPERTCLADLAKLAAKGYVEIVPMLVHPEIELPAPLATWQPKQVCPDLGAVSHRARQRWTLPSVTTKRVIATVAGANVFGGVGGRRPRTSEATHDTHLAAVYLRMLDELPVRARTWQSEGVIASRKQRRGFRPPPGERVPDAMVRDGRSATAIEFVGDYSPDKLRAFHAYCRQHTLGYELW